jgi:hypothetical protein
MGLVTLIASESANSETPFFIVGIALVVFAVAISVLGFTRPQFPGSDGAARGVMGVGAGLVVLTLVFVIYINA